MTRRFQVGDRVRVIVSGAVPHLVGAETVVTECMGFDYLGDGQDWYAVDLRDTDGEEWVYPEYALAPVGDDERKPLSWSDERVVWKPRVIA